jgi:hypothetical protein
MAEKAHRYCAIAFMMQRKTRRRNWIPACAGMTAFYFGHLRFSRGLLHKKAPQRLFMQA